MKMNQQDAPSIKEVNKFHVNDLVFVSVQGEPDFLKMALVRGEDIQHLLYKVKGLVVKGIKVLYRVERNNHLIDNIPEDCLVKPSEGTEDTTHPKHVWQEQFKDTPVVDDKVNENPAGEPAPVEAGKANVITKNPDEMSEKELDELTKPNDGSDKSKREAKSKAV